MLAICDVSNSEGWEGTAQIPANFFIITLLDTGIASK